MPAVNAEFLMMLMPLAAVIAILLGRQQQRVATVEQECRDMRRSLVTSESVFGMVPVGLAVLDCDLRYVRVNPLLADINGLPLEEHAGKTIRDVMPDIAAATELRIREVMATGRPLLGAMFEGATAAEPHLRRTWRKSIHPLYDRDATLLGVTIIIEDITEQQRLANALQESRQREQRRTSELEGLMQVAPAALFVAADRECRRIKANPAAEQLLRLREGGTMAMNDPGMRAFAVYSAGTLLPLDQLPLHRAASTGEAIRNEALTVRFADNDRLHVLINALPLRDEAGEIVGAVAGCIEAPAAQAAQPGNMPNAGTDG